MPADFPVPRSEIPKVEVSPQEYYERKVQMDAMADRIVQEFEEYSEVNKRHINLRRWKHVASRERCKLYKERPKYQTASGALGNGVRTRRNNPSVWRDDMSEDGTTSSYGQPMSSRSSTSSGGGTTGGRVRTKVAPSHASAMFITERTETEDEAETLRPNLMIGERPGRLEDAMHALVARDHDELSLVVVFLHQEVADCAILHTMEAPTPDEPYRYLGYKWFVKPSPAHARVIKNRDSLYVEYTGVTTTNTGEVVGYHIMHAIDIDGFPDFRDRNCVRATQSISTLYYQKEENMVEVFIMGNVAIGGTIGHSPVASYFAADTMFGMPRSIDCGEAKRLTEMVHQRRRTRAAQGTDLRKTSVMCRLCRSEKKSFNLVSLVTCEICAHTVCTRCRVHKKVFESDGILGKFNKFNCCKTCVIMIEQTHLPPAKPQKDKRDRLLSVASSNASMPRRPLRPRHWSDVSLPIYEGEQHDDMPTELSTDRSGTTVSSRGKMSMASTAASTVPSDGSMTNSLSMQDLLHHDEMTFTGPKSISESSEFDRSFAILSHSAVANNNNNEPRATNDRDTMMSADEFLNDDDWAARSYYNGRSAHPQHHDRFVNASRFHEASPRQVQQYPPFQQYQQYPHHHDPRLQLRSPSMRPHENHIQLAHRQRNLSARAPPPPLPPPTPQLHRHHSGGSAGSAGTREEVMSRMQQLSMLAEETYNTTKDNAHLLRQLDGNGQQQQQQQNGGRRLESRNRFFYY